MNRKIYLLDGSGYIYRAYHGIRELSTASGLPTNAIYGFTTLLLKLLREERPAQLVVIFDPPRGETFRSQLYPNYKANRTAMPDDLAAQIPYIKQMVRALNIATLEVPGFEADDVIATVARRCAAEGMEVTVVTGDKDLMQIVGVGIGLLDTLKDKRSGVAEVEQRFGVVPERVTDILGLAGDASDNIPGVPGIGEKTAAELVQRFGPLEEVLKWGHLVNGRKRREALRTYGDQARLSKVLATVRDDVPLELCLEELAPGIPDPAELLPLLQTLEFDNLALQFTPPKPGVVEVYCDGSGDVHQGPGGYGVVLRYGTTEKELFGFEPRSTSQRMELLAAIHALESLTKPCRVHVVSDSQYLVRGMTEWLEGWLRQGKLQTEGAMANQDLWLRLVAVSRQQSVTWEWVRGHNGHPFNGRADELASKALKQGRAAVAPKPPLEAATQAPPIDSPPPPAPAIPPAEKNPISFECEEDGQLRLYR
ncbi:MAG: ribonuclease HI [Desulfuromonadales bacterium]|nr:ribonuclease HI [Desulfuromonadales bacterium]